MDRIVAAPRRRAFDDDALAVAAPKGRKSGVAPFSEEMPDFKTELKNSKGKAKTFMALLNKVSRPGTGSLALRLVQLDPEDRPETTETLGSRERHRREPGRVPDAAEGAGKPDAQPDADGRCVTWRPDAVACKLSPRHGTEARSCGIQPNALLRYDKPFPRGKALR